MVRERDCCAFLTFVVQEKGDEIEVTVSAPEEARVAAETLLEQFITAPPPGAQKPARRPRLRLCGGCVLDSLRRTPVASGGCGAHAWMTGVPLHIVTAAWLWVWRERGLLCPRSASWASPLSSWPWRSFGPSSSLKLQARWGLKAVGHLSLFGLFAVTLMLVFYALEDRSPWFILAFAGACALGSIYGFLQGAWPFGVVEAIWAGVAVWRWQSHRTSEAG
jgi:hypothetical protein